MLNYFHALLTWYPTGYDTTVKVKLHLGHNSKFSVHDSS
jgi:hypothetical protein